MKNSKATLILSLVLGCLLGTATAFYRSTPAASSSVSVQETRESKHANHTFEQSLAFPQNDPSNRIETFDTRAEAAFAHSSQRRRDWEIERLFETMTAVEAPTLLQHILSNPEYHKPDSLLGSFFGKWGEIDGAAAFAAADALESRPQKDAQKYLFPAWARADVHAAWAASANYLSLPRPPFNGWLSDVLEEMAKQSPGTVVEYANQSSDGRMKSFVVEKSIRAISESGQFAGILSEIQGMKSQANQKEWAQKLFQSWASQNTDQALAAVHTLSAPEASAMEGLLVGWAAGDREAALDHLFANRNDSTVQNAQTAMIQSALQSGSESENLRLIERLQKAGMIVGAFSSFRTISNRQPSVVLQAADHISDQQKADNLRSTAIINWSRTDFNSAFEHFDRISSPQSKANIMLDITRPAMRVPSPNFSLSKLYHSIPPGEERTQALEKLLNFGSHIGPGLPQDLLKDLKDISESETQLSPAAEEARAKLFPSEN